jgi:hypothetical protein
VALAARKTDGRSGMDDAMDCFCIRCSRCGGLDYDPYGGDDCLCRDDDDDYDDEEHDQL